jgi:acyl transferase domain-containing protein
LADVGFSLVTARAALEHRAVVLADDRDAALAQLDALAAGDRVPGLVVGRVASGGAAFVLSGQGAQRPAMGRGLHERFPVFAAAFDEACALLDRGLADDLARAGHESLRELVLADRGPIDDTVFAQAGLFALEVALVRLLGSLGLHPEALAGHSIGELAAAHVAGVFDLDDAARLVAARGRLMQALPAGGAMVALDATEAEAHELIGGRGDLADRVAVAAVNGPAAVVLSGEKAAIDRLTRQWRSRGRRARRLRVSHAFHSPLVEPMLDDFARVAGTVDYRPPRLALVSTVTGERVTDEVCSADYWVDQVRRPVRFGDAVRTLVAEGTATLLEVGPDAQLTTLVPDNLDDEDVVTVPTLRPGRDETTTLVTAVAEAWVRGARVDWTPLFPGARRVDLPTYAFQRQRYWPVPATPPTALAGGGASGADGADGVDVADWRYGIVWRPPADRLPPPTPGQRWLLVTTDAVDPATVAWAQDALEAGSGQVVTLSLPAPVATDRAAVAAQLARVVDKDALAGVVSLVGLDETPDPTDTLLTGLAATLALVQALADAAVTTPLWTLTRSAVATTPPRPAHAAIWGLGRVVGLEMPERWGGLVDLPEVLDERAGAGLRAALGHRGGEDQLAVQATGGLLARRLARSLPRTAGEPEQEPWGTRGTALVTGGTGALGGRLARWLVDRGAEHVILASRRGAAAPGAEELAAEVERAGGRVTLAACDVADPAALDGLLAVVPPDLPLRTIVHCAGASVGGDLVDLTPDDMVEASAAKARGARSLHEVAERHGLELDAFVLFSSGASIWGGGGQGAYAAANAYVDALAEQRRAAGLPATSVAWGPWAGDGMAEGETGDRLRRLGVREMPPELALRALQQALDAGDACVAVADLDWARFAPSFAAARRRPLLEDLPEAVAALYPELVPAPANASTGADATADPRTDADASTALAAAIAGLDPGERRQALVELVREEVAVVLGHPNPAAVDPRRAFKDLGFDSVTAVELRNRLRSRTGLRLPATLVFDHPNPAALGYELALRTAPEPRSPTADALRHLAQAEAALAALHGPPAATAATAATAADGEAGEAVAEVRIALRRLLARLSPTADGDDAGGPSDQRIEDRLLAADDDELLAFIDRELG